MSDSDMIRRGDAHRTIVLTGEHVAGMKSSAVIDHVCAAIRALPAVSAQAQIDAAVAAERERCAKVAEGRIGVCDALRQASFWDDNCERLAKTSEAEARVIAEAIRKGGQP
jgi:Arc/MetJ family transcription regulator